MRVRQALANLGWARSIPICGSALAALLVIGAIVSGDSPAAKAALDCVPGGLCISLDPETASNPVNTDHTLTATLTRSGAPVEGREVSIYIFDGPNAEDHLDPTLTDANGEVSFTYPGDGGAGTDSIIAIDCPPGEQYLQFCLDVILALRDCPNPGLDPTCLAEAETACWNSEICFFDVASKEWVEPTPTATASPEPTSTVEAIDLSPVTSPGTGTGGPSGGPVPPWLVVAAAASAALAGAAAYGALRMRA